MAALLSAGLLVGMGAPMFAGPAQAATSTPPPPRAAPRQRHVGYPTGGAFAGVWADTATAAPASPTGHQLAVEAAAAAAHFGNPTGAANRNTEYFIVSPTGTTPDGFNAGGGVCAWHDFTADPSLPGGAASGPPVAFTNMPYVSDAGTSCGMGFVNSGAAGTLDGVTIVGGHTYAETITDQFPAGGWTDSAGNENGDKCAWIRTGQGASQNISLTTGSFAVQSTWANDFNNNAGGCLVYHAIVGAPGNTVTVTNPGNQAGTVGKAISLQISASDSGGAALTYSATGLPAGLSISASRLVSGAPTTAGTSSVTVTATDTTNAKGSASFTWTVNPVGTCTAAQLLGNPGFETGGAAPWTATPAVISKAGSEPAHSGSWMAWLAGYRTAHTDTVSQTVAVPSGCTNDTFSFWRHIDTGRRGTTVSDTLKVQVLNAGGTTVLQTLATYSNVNAASGFSQASFNLSAYAGQTIMLKFTGQDVGGSATTNFVIDDTAFNVS